MWVGQYRLTSRLATGGMAEVYVGRHITPEGQFGPMVAVKRLLPHLARDPAVVRMFLNEAHITSQIQHPNVVHIFELGTDAVKGEPFIAMELLEGNTYAELRLKAAEDGRRMPLGIALRVLTEACRGLDAAHRAVDETGQPLAVVHRDFTPDNIHVGRGGDVKVIDFGIAKSASLGSGTEPGTLKGKYFYMSPEMIRGEVVDQRADLFAAGVMLYEQLCGRRPFTGNSIDDVVQAIRAGKPQPPSRFDPSVPQALDAVCLTALNKIPASRFPSLRELCDTIEAIGGEVTIASASELSAYVQNLFPAQSDPKQQTLRRAREIDPSLPSYTPAQGAEPAAPVEPAPRAVHGDLAASVAASLPLANPEPKRRLVFGLAIGLVLGSVLGGGIWAWRHFKQSPAEVLAAVEAGQGQVGSLAMLVDAEGVTEAQLQKATALALDAKSWDVADRLAQAWGQRAPMSGNAKLAEGIAAARLKKAKRAESALLEADKLLGDDARPWSVLAELREAMGDATGALAAWERAVTRAPQARHPRVRVGYWQSQSGRLEAAQATLDGVLKQGFDAEAAAELAFVKFRMQRPDEALTLLEKVTKAKPEMMLARYYRATVLYQKGEVAKARSEYLAADALTTDDPRPLVALCELEAQQKSPSLAQTTKKLTSKFPAEGPSLVATCSQARLE